MRELSHHILDLLENAFAADVQLVTLEIEESSAENRLIISVKDDGRGMDQEMVQKVTDPFFTTRTTRHVGLGIPLLLAAAERCNGRFSIESEVDKGTYVRAEFQRDHIDRAPLGDIKSTLMGALVSLKECDLVYRHQVDDRSFAFDTKEIRSILGDVSLSHPRVREWFEDFLDEGLANLGKPG